MDNPTQPTPQPDPDDWTRDENGLRVRSSELLESYGHWKTRPGSARVIAAAKALGDNPSGPNAVELFFAVIEWDIDEMPNELLHAGYTEATKGPRP